MDGYKANCAFKDVDQKDKKPGNPPLPEKKSRYMAEWFAESLENHFQLEKWSLSSFRIQIFNFFVIKVAMED